MFMKPNLEEVTMSTNAVAPQTAAEAHYQAPDWFTAHVFNKVVGGLTQIGISVAGSRILEHRGRNTGELHRTPVNLLTFDGRQYLVAPRGVTQWVRNVRHADGHLVLILGRRRQICSVTELAPAEAIPVLRAYLRKWKFETGQFFDGLTPEATDEKWAQAAPRHPVFLVG
jgi:hypothetical protein